MAYLFMCIILFDNTYTFVFSLSSLNVKSTYQIYFCRLQYFRHLMWRVDSLEKTLMLGRIGGRRRTGRQDEMAGWHHWLDGCESEWIPGVGDGLGGLACCDFHGVAKSRTRLSDWTELNYLLSHCYSKWLCRISASGCIPIYSALSLLLEI